MFQEGAPTSHGFSPIVPRKMASKCQACFVMPAGGGMTQTTAAVSTHAASFLRSAPFQVVGGVVDAADTAGVDAEATTAGLHGFKLVRSLQPLPKELLFAAFACNLAAGRWTSPAVRWNRLLPFAVRPNFTRGMASADVTFAMSFVSFETFSRASLPRLRSPVRTFACKPTSCCALVAASVGTDPMRS